MKRGFVLVWVSVCLLMAAAFSTPHVMLLKDGTTIETKDKPNFDKKTGFYKYKDATGKTGEINKDAITEIKEK